jgi:hypothetical protein
MKDRKLYFQLYRKSKHGKMMRLLQSIEERCNNKRRKYYQYYGGKGIRNLLTYDDLIFIYDRDNAGNLIKPSIDRIDNNGNYSKDNCRFIELSENAGRNKKRAVLQIDKNKKNVRVWGSAIEAEKNGFQHGHISKCCQGKRKSHGGFSWQYL